MCDEIDFEGPEDDYSVGEEGELDFLMPTEIEDMPELCQIKIDELESVNYPPDDGNVSDTYHPTFEAHTKSEINAKIHEAENKIDHYKAMESNHAERAKYGDSAHAEYELRCARDMHREVEKWKDIKSQWENTKPSDK